MDAAAHSDEEYEDDLELLQKELDALKNVLGRGYQQVGTWTHMMVHGAPCLGAAVSA